MHPQINSSGFLKRKVPCIIMWPWSYFECYLFFFFFQFFVTFFLHVISSLSHFFCAILSSTTFCHFTKNIFYKKFYNKMSFLISTLLLWQGLVFFLKHYLLVVPVKAKEQFIWLSDASIHQLFKEKFSVYTPY